MIVWFFIGCLGNQHIRKVSNLSKSWSSEKLTELLDSPYSYVRLQTLQEIRRHQWVPDEESVDNLSSKLLEMVSSERETCPIRGQASYVLGNWNISDAALSIQTALNECDDESRYWMLQGLVQLTDNPYAVGIIQGLRTDGDLFIRNEALHWSQP